MLPVALVATAACSGGGRGPARASVTPSGNPAQAYRNFTTCMRQHGVNIADPDPNSDNVTIVPPPGSQAVWGPALRVCQHFLPAGDSAASDPQQLDALRRYAVCMRAHGVEMTDPDPNTGNGKLAGRYASMSRDQVLADPTYKAADAACEHLLLATQPPKKDTK